MEKRILDFLKALRKNNRREWFIENRDLYRQAQDDFSTFTNELIAGIEKFDPSIRGVRAGDCFFRIFRDVRFSRDKSPYKTNFGAFVVPGGKKSGLAGYYLHVEPGNRSMIAGGIHMPPAPALKKIRAHIDTRYQELNVILKRKAFRDYYGGLDADKLKTAPRGYSPDHPALDLLVFKSYTVARMVGDDELLKKDFMQKALRGFRLEKDFIDFLNRGLRKKI